MAINPFNKNQQPALSSLGSAGMNQQPVYTNPNDLKKKKIMVAVMIVVILIVVAIAFFALTGRKDPKIQKMEEVYSIHGEIIRVSDEVLKLDVLSDDGRFLAQTAKTVSISHRATASKILTEDMNGQITKELQVGTPDSSNDDALKQGALLDKLDTTYEEILFELLIKANASMSEANNGSKTVEDQLNTMSTSNEVIFDSLNS